MKINERVKPLIDWINWACNEKNIPSTFKANKAYEVLVKNICDEIDSEDDYKFYSFKKKEDRIPWSILGQLSKTMCLHYGEEVEGVALTVLIANCLERNSSAFNALICHTCAGFEEAESIIEETNHAN